MQLFRDQYLRRVTETLAGQVGNCETVAGFRLEVAFPIVPWVEVMNCDELPYSLSSRSMLLGITTGSAKSEQNL